MILSEFISSVRTLENLARQQKNVKNAFYNLLKILFNGSSSPIFSVKIEMALFAFFKISRGEFN
jgi:hypothetical protein